MSTPFSYSCKKSPKDAEDQLEAISGAAHAMKKSHGTLFTVSPCVSFLENGGWSHSVSPRRGRCVRHYTGQLDERVFSHSRRLSTTMVLSRAPGNIVDWVYKRMGVKYSFAAHLRDTGTVSLVSDPHPKQCLTLSAYFYSMALPFQSNG